MSGTHLSDEEIITGIRENSEKALSLLYKLHYQMTLRFVLNNSGTEQEAKDIYQEAIIVLYEKVREGQFDLQCKIKTYLYSVCRRLWLKQLTEKRRFVGNMMDAEGFIDLGDEMLLIEEKENRFRQMASAMSLLGEPCKTLLEDFYIHTLSMSMITDKFGYTNADNAKNQKYKCLMRLKKLFFTDLKKEVHNE